MISKLNNRYGPEHPSWKSGKYVNRKLILKGNKDPICRKCGRDDKRILLIHHLDGDQANNDLSNLTWLCYNCHWLVHVHGESVS